jgi:hypothetical protein
MNAILGILVVAVGGLIMGSGAWPFKLMRKYQFEHWWLVGMFVGLIAIPWTVMLLGCPDVFQAIQEIPASALWKGNLFAVGWGIANVLCGICYVRIGMALTGAILAGLGASLGTIVPMIFKAPGLFENAPDLLSATGLTVCLGIVLMLCGVVVVSQAGLARDRELKKLQTTSGGFLGGLIMTVIAGILSSFMSFAFIYSQDPIVAALSPVRAGMSVDISITGMKDLTGRYEVGADGNVVLPKLGAVAVGVGGTRANHAVEQVKARLGEIMPDKKDAKVVVSTGHIPATLGVFALAIFGGAVVNLGYAVYLLTKNRSWGVLCTSFREFLLAVVIGANFTIAVSLMGKGMLLLGSLGASVGWGIYQAMQLTGTQLAGFASGEWRGVYGKPRLQIYTALGILLVASVVIALGKAWGQ